MRFYRLLIAAIFACAVATPAAAVVVEHQETYYYLNRAGTLNDDVGFIASDAVPVALLNGILNSQPLDYSDFSIDAGVSGSFIVRRILSDGTIVGGATGFDGFSGAVGPFDANVSSTFFQPFSLNLSNTVGFIIDQSIEETIFTCVNAECLSHAPGSVDPFTISISLQNDLVATAAAAPEPPTWAMMLLGLTGIALAACRGIKAPQSPIA